MSVKQWSQTVRDRTAWADTQRVPSSSGAVAHALTLKQFSSLGCNTWKPYWPSSISACGSLNESIDLFRRELATKTDLEYFRINIAELSPF
eukprot:22159-Karenia_brevis.AAC.1